MIGLHALDDAACAISGHSIGDEDFDVTLRVVLRQDGFQAALDSGGLIADRDQDGDEGKFQ